MEQRCVMMPSPFDHLMQIVGECYEKAEELFAIFGNNFLRDRVIVQYFCGILDHEYETLLFDSRATAARNFDDVLCQNTDGGNGFL